MSVPCPTCRAAVRPANPRPGRFRAACPACGARFAVTVPADPAAAWHVHAAPQRAAHALAGSVVFDPPTRPAPVPFAPADSTATGPTPPPRLARAPRPPAGSVPDIAPPDGPDRMPDRIPGYDLDKPLGHGGMGTVYLARQLSLDRPVAIKVMARRWSQDPVFVARFTREAFAAALLNHPNVVQIYDIGEAEGVRFFSMEYVPGRTLADHVKAEGKVDCETAVGYVLQAARGLRHAHDRGMIHRDVKPDNLLLDDQGCVKVADLGLVKTPGLAAADDRPNGSAAGLAGLPADMTGAKMALGTPAYMAPEQCRDATTVDHRADIYSLGCTLYVLVTGRPPFDGATAVELMTKHAYQPIVPPEAIVGRVPKELSAVILKMLAKGKDDRFQSMADVIRTLEQWLGVHHAGTFTPRDDQIEELEAQVARFHAAPVAVLKARVVTGAVAGCLLAAVLLAFFGRLGWAFGAAGFVVQAAAAYFVLTGVQEKTYVFRRVRQFAFGLTAWDYALAAAGAVLAGVLMGGLGLLSVWAGFGVFGVAAAVALRVGFDRAIDADRAGPLADTQRLLRKMRRDGLAEDDLRLFVAKYAGRQWEEFFEALFGFEAKLSARNLLLRGGSAGVRDKFAAWREPVVNLIDRWEKARREAADRALLGGVEEARLVSAGVSGSAAHAQAAAQAELLVACAGSIRRAGRGTMTAAAPATAPNLGQLLAGSTPSPVIAPRDRGYGLAGAACNLVVGPHVRAVVAGVLLGGCALWAVQNRPAAAVRAPATADDLAAQAEALTRAATTPLVVDGVPPQYTAWVDSANVGWAGALLLASLFARGNRMAALVLLGAGVCAFGPRLGIRTVDPVQPAHVALLLGSVLALSGYRLGRG